jgi:high affinity Mn2+ porin
MQKNNNQVLMSRVSVLALVAVLMGALPVTRATQAHANEQPVHEFAIVMVDPPSPALAADQSPQKLQEETPLWRPQLLGAQSTIIGRHLYPLHSPYSSNLSLGTDGDTQTTKTFGAFFGMALASNLQAYLDFEMFKGAGISNATGLGGLTDGDVMREGANDLGKGPYVTRKYLRYVLPLGDDRREVGGVQDQVPGTEALSRLEFKIGTMAVVDDLDRNRYANSPRTEFQNWSLTNNAAWDFNADTQGFTNGIMVGYIQPHWALRFGVYQMPSEANGQDLDAPLSGARGENLELTLQPSCHETVVRLLEYRNIACMGIYRDAIARGIAQGTPPDIVAEDKDGR